MIWSSKNYFPHHKMFSGNRLIAFSTKGFVGVENLFRAFAQIIAVFELKLQL